MAELDLDAVRAARLEAIGELHTFTFGGEQFTLPPELPAAAPMAVVQGISEAGALIAVILGEEQTQRLISAGASQQDMKALLEWAMPLYGGKDEGESSAGPGSPASAGPSSSPTSNGSTVSTSRPRSGGRRRSPSGASGS